MPNVLIEYLEWLCARVHGEDRFDILRTMFEQEFRPLADNDDNRVADGLCLREEFMEGRQRSSEGDTKILRKYIPNLLEVLVAFADRAFDVAGNYSPFNEIGWFWKFVENLDLLSPKTPEERRKIIAKFCATYVKRSRYHIFPTKNRRGIEMKELWYQLQDFLDENYPF